MASSKFLKNTIKISLFIIAFLILIYIIFLLFLHKTNETLNPITDIYINNKLIKAEVVSSPMKQYLGLSGRESLCPDCGMLFSFSDVDEREFVMRNMNFPLDIVFINKNKIVNIAANLPPEGTNTQNIYSSNGPADNVLEINGGRAKQYGINVGDTVNINNN